MTDDPYQLEVRVGPHHFVASGPLEAVREDYQRFLHSLNHAAPMTPFRSCGKPWPAVPDELSRHFAIHDDGIVTLTRPAPEPISEARSLLALLFGFCVIEAQASVTASDLRHAAERSGLTIARIDRALARYVEKGFVVREGNKRGTLYALSESGMQWTKAYLRKAGQSESSQ